MVSLIVVAVVISKDSSSDENKKANNTTNTSPQGTLMFTGETPCSPTFDYSFDMKVGGPVKIKYPGVSDTIYWDGISDIQAPRRNSGPVYICSSNPSDPHVWVKIWKK